MSRSISLVFALSFAVACTEAADGPSQDSDAVDSGPSAPEGFDIGEMAPNFTLPNAEGQTVSLTDYQGGRVAVVGTASW
ncbi:MAG: cytochrome oxidase Cu insertion factor (SCO1/SenC/PrrC family) [Cognaticolwellia sp.]|jgi:cytochrome oxidase Cu insertion factor (SCO1/SenC/PrrC family)